jgi:addiction module RelB/DinJ family antitoxin
LTEKDIIPDVFDIAYALKYNVYTKTGGAFMPKDTSISIRLDSQLKEQTESILTQFGLNMTSVINMLFHQIVREQEIPLSLTLKSQLCVLDELNLAKAERLSGYQGREANRVITDMERIIMRAENDSKKV